MSLSVVCWKWVPKVAYHSTFTGEHVNVLRRMVQRHYAKSHRFICVTDDPTGINGDVEIIPLWKDHANILSPAGAQAVSCYRRLKMFSKEAVNLFGERFVSLDLDCVILNNVSPLWDHDVDFKIWGDTARSTPYNGSMIQLNAGARPQVWETFDPVKSPRIGKSLGYVGSDQAWIGVCLGPNEQKWNRNDGVLSFRNDVPRMGHNVLSSRIVFFHGRRKPWQPDVQKQYPWVKKHWV